MRKIPWILLVLLTACNGLSSEEISAYPTGTLSLITTEIEGLSTPTFVVTAAITPTARIFGNGNCNSIDVKGHIFFMQGNGSGNRNRASTYDLYVMDGNGCFPNFVMPEVSGSPSWSTDGNRLAIGCENNTSLCILDTKATLNTCISSEKKTGQCQPILIQKFELPQKISGDERMYNISWAFDGLQVAVEGGSEVTHQYFVYLLTLADSRTWEVLIQGLSKFNVAWSPKDEQLAFSGLVLINPHSTNLVASGYFPEWSPDGKKIAFVKNSLDDNKEAYGIALISLDSENWKWLYEPILRDDRYYFPPHNILIRDNGQDHRLLSWSPDEQYIAFVSESGLGSKSHIYRLNIATGEIVILTANLESDAFYAPAWGP